MRTRRNNHFPNRLTAAQHRFERVPDQGPGSEVLYFRHWAVARQIRVCEQGRRGNVNARLDHHIPGRSQRDRLQPLAYPVGPGVAATHEYRHVGPQAQAQRGQRVFVQAGLPEPVQHDQYGGRIR
ncbi:hypothetical protein G6F68_019989 [Rhizopus microsporus]|nr:hypothetical protein G6F68_019989 [Rhizopus microsporus]